MAGGHVPPQSFGISVNPIRTKRGRLFPPYYYWPPIFLDDAASLWYMPTLNSLYCKPPNFSDILLLLNIPPAVYGFCPTLPSLVICNQMPNFQRIPTNEFKYLDALHLKSDFTRKIWVSFGNRKCFTMESFLNSYTHKI